MRTIRKWFAAGILFGSFLKSTVILFISLDVEASLIEGKLQACWHFDSSILMGLVWRSHKRTTCCCWQGIIVAGTNLLGHIDGCGILRVAAPGLVTYVFVFFHFENINMELYTWVQLTHTIKCSARCQQMLLFSTKIIINFLKIVLFYS